MAERAAASVGVGARTVMLVVGAIMVCEIGGYVAMIGSVRMAARFAVPMMTIGVTRGVMLVVGRGLSDDSLSFERSERK